MGSFEVDDGRVHYGFLFSATGEVLNCVGDLLVGGDEFAEDSVEFVLGWLSVRDSCFDLLELLLEDSAVVCQFTVVFRFYYELVLYLFSHFDAVSNKLLTFC